MLSFAEFTAFEIAREKKEALAAVAAAAAAAAAGPVVLSFAEFTAFEIAREKKEAQAAVAAAAAAGPVVLALSCWPLLSSPPLRLLVSRKKLCLPLLLLLLLQPCRAVLC